MPLPVESGLDVEDEIGDFLGCFLEDLVGVDVYLDWSQGSPDELGERFKQVGNDELVLTMITNRGAKVWPNGMAETFCTDHWRARFMAPKRGERVKHEEIITLLKRVTEAGYDFIKIENLYNFDGKPNFSTVSGE